MPICIVRLNPAMSEHYTVQEVCLHHGAEVVLLLVLSPRATILPAGSRWADLPSEPISAVPWSAALPSSAGPGQENRTREKILAILILYRDGSVPLHHRMRLLNPDSCYHPTVTPVPPGMNLFLYRTAEQFSGPRFPDFHPPHTQCCCISHRQVETCSAKVWPTPSIWSHDLGPQKSMRF